MAITAAKKAPNPTDRHVGARVRMRRKMLAMSQTQLADALGITYQQVQKNESGTNRIGASRLQQISHILQVPVAFFFEGGPNGSALSIAQIDDFVADGVVLDAHASFLKWWCAPAQALSSARVEDVRGQAAFPTFFIVPSVNASAEKENEY